MLDYGLNARSKAASYRALLSAFLDNGFTSLTLLDGCRVPLDATVKNLYVRHDVDHNLEVALGMARMEHELGIKASYYLLPPGDYNADENYYGKLVGNEVVHSERLKEVVLEIHALGHEIGLHNDFLQLSFKLKRGVAELIAGEIDYFAGLGIPVRGTASHGSRFVRAHALANYEVFAECKKASSVERSVTLPDESMFELFSVSFRALGLEYEGYHIKRDAYVADTGSRFTVNKDHYETVNPNLIADQVSACQRVVLLIHPEWWKPVDANAAPVAAPTSLFIPPSAVLPAAPSGISFLRADGKPLRIAVRGDCCSRRAVALNKQLFPKGVELMINEKSPSICFGDTVLGKTPSQEQVLALSDTEIMHTTLKHYYLSQLDRSILSGEQLDLLIIDSYADMNFELWEHVDEGWKVWVHPKYFQKDSDIGLKMRKIGYARLEDAVTSICHMIDHLRVKNPLLPVLFLNQPIEHYPKLEKRKEFYELGRLVAAARPSVYFAGALTAEQLEPADVGSCGPGLTLHFAGATYLQMIEQAWQKGLSRHFPAKPDGAAPVAPAPAAAAVGMRFLRADGKPFRIGIRGDFSARRAVALNKQLFPSGSELIVNEKSPIVCAGDAARGVVATLEQALALCDTEAMHPTLKHYYLNQLDHSLLAAEQLDLLIIDPYADMNYELWTHVTEGWKIWVHPTYFKKDGELAAKMRKIGPVALADAVAGACAMIDHLRLKNPQLPVLFLNQPIDYYARLEKRREFDGLGALVAAARPHVYHAMAQEGKFEPADLGSGGPGMTLYFSAETYLAMLQRAWDQGLKMHVQKPAPAAPEVDLPRAEVSFLKNTAECRPECAPTVASALKSYREYFRLPEENGPLHQRFYPMLIDVGDFADFPAWEKHIKGFSGGERMRQKKKALAAGYFVKPFAWKLFIPDIHDVNHSKAIRSGGPMRGSYQKSVEEMGGAPQSRLDVVWPKCPYHWGLTFGVFLPLVGHTQGAVTVDEKLVGYISLRRTGELAVYSMILGHADHLDNGVLVLLHHELVKWIGAQKDGLCKGLRYLMYGGQQNGGKGLSQWKRRGGFTPHFVTALSASA